MDENLENIQENNTGISDTDARPFTDQELADALDGEKLKNPEGTNEYAATDTVTIDGEEVILIIPDAVSNVDEYASESSEAGAQEYDDIDEPESDGSIAPDTMYNTAVIPTIGSVTAGERVMVVLKNGIPTAMGSTGFGDDLNVRVHEIEADYIKTEVLEAERARIATLETNSLTANSAVITNLEAETAKIKNVTADDITSATGYIKTLKSNSINANDIVADHASISLIESDYIKTSDLEAERAEIDNLLADKADISELEANYAHITNGAIDNATIGHAKVNGLDAQIASIADAEIANATITQAQVENLAADYAKITNGKIDSALIDTAAIVDEQVFTVTGNKATISEINADSINVRNLHTSNLVVDSAEGYVTIGNKKTPTKEFLDQLTNTLQQEIDGAVETFTSSAVPLLNNYPASDWQISGATAEEQRKAYAKHVGDICYVQNAASAQNGYAYRFAYDSTEQTFKWVLIKDSDVTKALGDISDLQTFESETNTWIQETDEGLRTIRENHTTLSGVVDKTMINSTQLWFSKANTTAPNKPTAEVTSTSTAGNAWRTVVPAYNASYPNYFYCYQWEYADGTFGWSAVTRDIAMGETQATSRTASTNASNAVATANTANTNATNAVNTANSANETAEAASTKADTANTNASNAVSTANTASTNASNAVATANTASTNASNAVSTANTANATANTAQNTANANIKSSVQLWFTKANNTFPSKPTSVISTNNASTANTWNLAVPTYNASYPHYFYCYQQQKGDGTYQWSDVIYDRATTENQAVARAALPSATFETFRTTTFKEVVDTVDEQSTTISTLTEKTSTIANPNLTPWFSAQNSAYWNTGFSVDYDYATGHGHSSSTEGSKDVTYLNDGWMHIIQDSRSSAGSQNKSNYVNMWVNRGKLGPIVEGGTYTWLLEVKNLTFIQASSSSRLTVAPSVGNATLDIFGGMSGSDAPIGIRFTEDSCSWVKVTAKDDFSALTRDTRGYCAIPAECYAEYDLRISLYEGEYSGPYKPYVERLENIKEISNTINTVKQTADTNTASITSLTETVADNKTEIESRASTIEQNLSGITTRVSKTESDLETVSNPNLSPFFSQPFDDIYNATTNPDGYWSPNGSGLLLNGFSYIGDGWAHFSYDNTSSSSYYPKFWVNAASTPKSLKPSTTYTFLLELRNYSSTDARTWIGVATNNATYTDAFAGSVTKTIGTTAQPAYYILATTEADISNKTLFNYAEVCVYSNSTVSFDIRLSIYEGQYTGSYKPYVDYTLTSRVSTAETSIKQHDDEIELRATKTELAKETRQRKGTYAECTTDAATVNKVATISPAVSDFELYPGVTVAVCFTTGNSVASPKLNVNNTGLYPIVVNGTATPALEAVKWNAYTTAMFTFDIRNQWRLVSTDEDVRRLTTAETKIEQNSDALTLTATKTEVYQTSQPNLIPFFSSTPVADTSKNSYWISKSGTNYSLATFTDVGDGWCHIYLDNTEYSAVSRCDFTCLASPSIENDADYTFLFEYRNNNTTQPTGSHNSQVYIVQQGSPISVQFWGNYAQKLIDGYGTNCTVNLDGKVESAGELFEDGVYRKRVVRKSEAADSSYYNRTGAKACFCFTAYAAEGAILDVEMRLSVYPGEYTGPYKPYAGAQLYASQAQLKIANDAISLRVEKGDVINQINVSSEGAKIKANKVEIDGTAVFSSIESQLNNAYDAKGSAATVQENLDNLQVGGRNYILNSASLSNSSLGSADGSRKEYFYINVGKSYMDIPHGTEVTISFDLYMTVNSADPMLQVYNTNNKGPKAFSVQKNGGGSSPGVLTRFDAAVGSVIDERISVTGYINDRNSPNAQDNFLEFYSNYGSSNWFSVSNLKLEIGNKATDWTPAPEDHNTYADSAVDALSIGGRNYAKTNFSKYPVGKSETRQSNVAATIKGPSTITLNGSCETTDWFFSSPDVFGGLVLEPGTYKLWYTIPNVGVRVGIGTNGATWFFENGDCPKNSPATMTVTTEQAYYFVPFGKVGATFNNQEARFMVEKGDKATDWTPAPEDQTAYVDNSVSSIQIGGRNLLRRTEVPFSYAINTTSYGTHHLYSTGTTDTAYDGPMLSELGLAAGDEVTFSFDWITSQNGSNDIRYGSFRIEFYGEKSDGTDGYITRFDNVVTMSASNFSGHYSETETLTAATVKTKRMVLRIDNSALVFAVSNVKLEKGNKATDWTPAPEDTNDLVSANRTNLIAYNPDPATLLPRVYVGEVVNRYPAWAHQASENGNSRGTQFVTNYTNNTASNRYLMFCPFTKVDFAPGDVFRFEGRLINWDSTLSNVLFSLWTYNDSFTYITNYRSAVFTLPGNAWTDIQAELTVPTSTDLSNARYYLLSIHDNTNSDPHRFGVAANSVIYKVSKNEQSTKSLATAAAPKANAIARSQRIYYRATSASGKPAANTTWLAASGTGYGNWSLSIPKLTLVSGSTETKYPFLYTAVQTQTVAQQAAGTTCNCTTVLIDETTTVIDGATIITGSVHANVIDANSGTFAEANIPNLSAAKIKANVIEAVNGGTGKISADKINVSAIKIGDLSGSIGGRNLLVGSSTGTEWTYSTFDADTITYTRATTAVGESYVYAQPMMFEPGQEYTVSCYAKSNGYVKNLDLYKVHQSGGGSHQQKQGISLTTEYQKIVWTFTCNATEVETAYIRFDNNGSTTSGTNAILYIKEPKLEKGSRATDWMPAPEDQTAYVDDSVSNIQVGGRNLLRDSIFTAALGTYWVVDGLTASVSNSSLVIDGSSASGNKRIYQGLAYFKHEEGITYTISCDIVSTAACKISFGRRYSTVDEGGVTFDVTTTKKRVSGTYQTIAAAFCIGQPTNNATVTISNIKLERGNKPTDWSPAPEDISQMVKINTAVRNFTTAQWKRFGTVGHVESWTTGSSYNNSHIHVGDTAYVIGTVTDGVKGTATIIGTVTAVNGTNGTTSITMSSTQLIFGGDSVDAAAKTATTYLTEGTSNGLMVHRSTDATTGVQIDDDVDIMRSGVSVANYGSTARIGPENGQHVTISQNSLSIYYQEVNGTIKRGLSLYATVDSSSADSFVRGINFRPEVTNLDQRIYTNGNGELRIASKKTSGSSVTKSAIYLDAEDVTCQHTLSLGSPLSIASGGTGCDSVENYAYGNVLTAASGVTLSYVTCTVWGAMCQITLTAKPSAAKTATWTAATVVQAFRPRSLVTAAPYHTGVACAQLKSTGEIQFPACAANVTIPVSFIYILNNPQIPISPSS